MDFTDPKAVVARLNLRPGMHVGDFGAGSGHYAVAVAQAVGPDGRVYAVDVQEDVLAHVRFLAEKDNLHNIETIWGDFEKSRGSKLRDQMLDAAILSNTLFQLDDRAGALAEIKRTLKSGGALVVIDWNGSYGGLGPAPEHLVGEQDAAALCTTAGFTKTSELAPGPHHYGIIFTAP